MPELHLIRVLFSVKHQYRSTIFNSQLALFGADLMHILVGTPVFEQYIFIVLNLCVQ